MAAFDKVLSGIPEMDKAFDYIRLGDNLVWRVSTLEEFKIFMNPFVDQAIKDKRNIVYFRFASHEPLLEDCPEIKTIHIPLTHNFEKFTVGIHNEIENEENNTFYIFDCLSDLQTAWATDLMMGNFFRVTCPFLHSQNSVAFLPIIRETHSSLAINKVKDVSQLFIDIYSDGKKIYVRPRKISNRNSDTMLLPHIYNQETGDFSPILDEKESSKFYQFKKKFLTQINDSWDRFFRHTKMLYDNHMDLKDSCSTMCDLIMTRDKKLGELVKKHFTPEDYFTVRDHMIGTGLIGKKACGMLLSRAIVRNTASDIDSIMEPHDSFFIGTDMYYTYIVNNDLWDLRIRQRKDEGYFSLAEEFAEKLKQGSFSEEMVKKLKYILRYYGYDPYIVRSSSLLEDGFGNAFAGKYESVFCANRGTMEERVLEFENAIKTVYASSISLSALDYRKRHGLDKKDEQMALLIQRVSGSRYGSYYMPCAAGVGYSYSPYKFLKKIDQKAGMLRLVMGLGTSAVDRIEGSYPRLVSLDMPLATTSTTIAEKHQFSQRKVEVVDLESRSLKQINLEQIEPVLPAHLKKVLLEHDFEVENKLYERGIIRAVRFISCQGLVKQEILMQQMQRIMKLLQKEYKYPVDIEYTINVSKDGQHTINLLQCRPLQVFKDTGNVSIPENIKEENILLENINSSMGLSRNTPIDYIVYIEPLAYYNMHYMEKSKVSAFLGKVNWHFKGQNKHMMLIVPGRICTSSPELGISSTFADISEFEVICELEEKSAGYDPELSYGSHIFQDLVEAEILYTAIFSNEKTKKFAPKKFKEFPDIANEFIDDKILNGVVHVYDMSKQNCELFHDLEHEHLIVKI